MATFRRWAVIIGAFVLAQAYDYDVVVYESTPGGIMTAVASGRQGVRTALVAATNHIGGICSSGLGQTDKGDDSVIGGLALEFFTRNGKVYNQNSPMWNLEPHVASAIFMEMLKEANVTIFLNASVDHVTVANSQIKSFTSVDGRTFTATVFADGSYEGDLLAKAGASYAIGREAIAQYNESLSGVRASAQGHEFEHRVDPYDDRGNLLPFVMDDTNGKRGEPGAADKRVQAYNFRLCVTQNVSNMVAFTEPEGYDASQWELARRYYNYSAPQVPSCNTRSVPNGKFDMNNCGPVSSDYINHASNWPEASYAERAEIWQAHKNYTLGLLWFYRSDPSLSDTVHKEMASWGLCKDEFEEYNHWPPQLYVREGRRMVGDNVFTQSYVAGNRNVPLGNLSIGMGSYNYDAHNAHRFVCKDPSVCTAFQVPYVYNEGDVETNPGYHYQIPAWVVYPKRSELTNLVAPVPSSASHIGYATLRMEPQFMIVGHAAGNIAALAVKAGSAVQDVDVADLATLLDQEQAIRAQTPTPPPPPAPPATCTFEEGYDYDHGETSFHAANEQECCNQCAASKTCDYAIFRSQGSPDNTCWPTSGSPTGKVAKVNVSMCLVSQ